ncbi:pickpocket protein 19 isoform X1 [Anastrepha ludens]|uniref:pickpocket protein 19 isoform X1 n=2 Tax=Anastrepha ludens TaxID=28586 RepID=UPI0023B130A9|nr:pickpocket protein 19 isoform X1 [Anastrepha ludens]
MRIDSFFKKICHYFTITRLFWTVVISISCWNMSSIFILMFKRYLSDSISISVETSFLRWSNTFPSVTLCLSKNRSNTEVMDYVNQHNINYIKNIHNYLFVTPTNINIKENYCKGLNSTCGVNIHIARKQLLTQVCESIITGVTFLDDEHKCEKIFKFHDLEMGYCFLANNIIDYHNLDELPLRFGSFGARKSLKMFLKPASFWRYEMYVHSNEDIPYFGLLSHTLGQDHIKYTYNMEEMQNSVEVIDESFKTRKCKSPHDVIYGSFYHYSFSTCMTDLRIVLEVKYCNCTLFTSPKKYFNYFCDIHGMVCVSKADITSKAKQIAREKYICYPSCSELKLQFVGSAEIKKSSQAGFALIEIELQNTPSLRYIRSVTQTHLDLVVSAGGVIGLFIGASILSAIECTYFFFKKSFIM